MRLAPQEGQNPSRLQEEYVFYSNNSIANERANFQLTDNISQSIPEW
jgi:hypothetical protein